MREIKLEDNEIWGQTSAQDALRQVMDLCQKALSLDIEISLDGASFSTRAGEKKQPDGILSAFGEIRGDSAIAVRMELVRGTREIRVSSGPFFKHLSNLGDKVRLLPPRDETEEETSLWVELNVKASPMGMARSGAFLEELSHLKKLAKALQEELPVPKTDSDLQKQYSKFSGALEPIQPVGSGDVQDFTELVDWAQETGDFLAGSISVAVASPFPVALDFSLSLLAQVSLKSGKSLGRLIAPAINARGLLDMTKQAPGIIVVDGVRITLGTNPYEMGNEMRALLAALTSSGKPVIFSGPLEQLQAVFSGGQGAAADPLYPVLRHVPDISLGPLIQFAVRSACSRTGGLPKRVEDELAEMLSDSVRSLDPAAQKRVLPVAASRLAEERFRGAANGYSTGTFISRVAGLSETLSGLSARPRAKRTPGVQANLTKALTDPRLLPYLKENLLAQDRALAQLVSRLAMEALTRPSHQPIRYCAQGTPATGKSESAALLATKLGIPYVNIDAASMPDYHTAASQLLGSGRGIVMSHQAGRLEQVAKHHTGVLVEVSDLDHAVPAVRAVLADLFLQVLETGEAQSATGAMFSCANLIFAFTMNLPGGTDEALRKGIGFSNSTTKQDVTKKVISEIKEMLSSAFLSRIGMPILFEPLNGEALAVVLERAIRKAIASAADRLGVRIKNVILEKNLGINLVSSMEVSITSFGARALLEHGRSMAATAFMELYQNPGGIRNQTVHVSVNSGGKLTIIFE